MLGVLDALALVHLARWIAREDENNRYTPAQQVIGAGKPTVAVGPGTTSSGTSVKPPTAVMEVEEQYRPVVRSRQYVLFRGSDSHAERTWRRGWYQHQGQKGKGTARRRYQAFGGA